MNKKYSAPSMNNDEELERVKGLAQSNYDYFKHNVKNYHAMREFLFLGTVSSEDEGMMNSLGITAIEVNSLIPIYNNVLGRAINMEPSLGVKPLNSFDLDVDSDQISPQQVAQAIQTKVIDGHLQRRLLEGNYKDIPIRSLADSLSGGYSCWKIYTDYKDEMTFEQDIFWEKCDDPTMIFFSPDAREPSKCDAKCVVKLVPMTVKDVKDKYGVDLKDKDYEKPIQTDGMDNLTWFYEGKSKDEKIIMVADFYEKKKKKVKVMKVRDPENTDPNSFLALTQEEYDEMERRWKELNSIGLFPTPVEGASVMRERTTIYHSQFIGDQFLSNPVKTEKKLLPYVFVEGSSEYIKGKQYTRAYMQYAVGAQRAKNFLFSDLVNQAENSSRFKIVMPERGVPSTTSYRDALEDPAKNWGVYFYRDIDPDNQTSPVIPPPIIVQPQGINPQTMAFLIDIDRNINTITGTHSAQMGVDNKQLSGRAFNASVDSSIQTDKPQWNGLMAALQQVGRIWLSLMPEVYKELRTIDTINEDGNPESIKINQSLPNGEKDPYSTMDFDHKDFEVTVGASLNMETEKRESFAKMMELIARVPAAQNFFSANLGKLIDSTGIRGADALALDFDKFKKETKEASKNQPPPAELVLAQAEMKKAENEMTAIKSKSQYENRNLDVKEKGIELDKVKLMNEIAIAAQNANSKESKDKFYMILDAVEADRKGAESEAKRNNQ